MAIDLHTHTVYSDGGLTPKELIIKAKEIGLEAVAVSDHDSVSGIKEAIETGRQLGVEVVPAIEVSAHPDSENEYHILGYYIDWESAELAKFLKESRRVREERAKKVVQRLNELGYKVSFEEVEKQTKGTIVQPHLALAVINNQMNKEKLTAEYGHIPTTGEFIGDHLIQGKDAYIPRDAMTPKEAIDLVHQVNGIAVLAHPCWNLAKKEGKNILFNDQAIDELINLGLEGIEVFAHRDSEEDTRICVEHFSKLAEDKGLLATGGSDFHGYGSAGKKLGFEDFYLKVPSQLLKTIKERKFGARL